MRLRILIALLILSYTSFILNEFESYKLWSALYLSMLPTIGLCVALMFDRRARILHFLKEYRNNPKTEPMSLSALKQNRPSKLRQWLAGDIDKYAIAVKMQKDPSSWPF